jgi:threonine dehydrogenase-like Zn-dependent dehydrogenase
LAKAAHSATALLPNALAAKLMMRAGTDRLAALHTAINLVRRGGTISIVGVYGGATDPMPMLPMFDKQIHIRMGQANVRHWTEDLLPLVVDRDVLGVDEFATHHLPLDDAPEAYRKFRDKEDGRVKVVFQP